MTYLRFLVVAVLVFSPLAAHVAASDPVSQTGFFDGADHDDDIAFVRVLAGVLPALLHEPRGGRAAQALVVHSEVPVSVRLPPVREGRAPPAL
jgi:hypothetical protein